MPDTTEVNLDEFLDEDEILITEQNTDGEPQQNLPASEFEEEVYLHLEIDFDEDPYELPDGIDMKKPLGRDGESVDSETPDTDESDTEFDLLVEEWHGDEESD